ncbi:amidohydrolase family protein [Goodfellowiella coeruleoviolacea]|uniref:amidohydrolase family protein n=1 Tax=Goodfellowiella coeruleoviolacea TaxID=334858 RepID=UPI0020A526F8|nr:amidohydrolase family protein [Goodfellowiella coeruleoviolacea]
MGKLHPSLDRVLDAHTHLSGSDSGESPDAIVSTMDDAGVDKAFVFAPLLNTRSWQLDEDDLEHIQTHNDYCADICSAAPERLYGFCVLNPTPSLGGGDKHQAVSLMVEELHRCYHDLGLRGVKMVPSGWYPNDPAMLPLYEAIANAHMYTVFHVGIFLDAKEGSFCRPAFYEQVHQVSTMRVQLAHLGWPWVDETLAVLAQEKMTHGSDPARWQMRADVSFGPPDDWQLSSWERALTSVEPQRLIYGSDGFWPMEADRYVQAHLLPQLGVFETAATLGHVAEEGTDERHQLRQQIFFDNAWSHWCNAVREPQAPRRAGRTISTPQAAQKAH